MNQLSLQAAAEPRDKALTGDFDSDGRVTIYLIGDFGMGYRRLEAKTATVRRIQYAQYASAVQLRLRQPRQRVDREAVQTRFPNIVILQGWGHPDPKSPWGTAQRSASGVEVSQMRHRAFSGAWQTEFDAMLADYVKTSGATVLRDYRGCDTQVPIDTTEQAGGAA